MDRETNTSSQLLNGLLRRGNLSLRGFKVDLDDLLTLTPCSTSCHLLVVDGGLLPVTSGDAQPWCPEAQAWPSHESKQEPVWRWEGRM